METQLQQMQAQMQTMLGQLQRLTAENEMLKQQASASGNPHQLHLQIMASMEAMTKRIEGLDKTKTTLVDVKGLGKPTVFNNSHEQWSKWSRSLQNYVIGVFGEGFRALIEHAAESEGDIKKTDVEELFGEGADEIDKIEDI